MPAPYVGQGLYDWLRDREPRWASLAIIHRLDKETSGLIVFGKTPQANRSLTRQFTERTVKKVYALLTDCPVTRPEFTVKSALVRAGEKYVSRPGHAGATMAETRFRLLRNENGGALLQAEPVTGRTHQIRVHAADEGIPILGDELYRGAPFHRLALHAERIEFDHPVTGARMNFSVPADFTGDSRAALRRAFIIAAETNAWRIIHGASDGWPGWYVDKLGDFILSQAEGELTHEQNEFLADARGVYHKRLTRHVRKTAVDQASPMLIHGESAPGRFTILENGLHYQLSFAEGYSVGLFLDQRENRRRLLHNYIAPGFPVVGRDVPGTAPLDGCEVLNTFAYTCAFSVAAAKAGAHVTSLDLSKKYLDWGRRNFELNELDHTEHDFIYGDAFAWMRRLEKKRRLFDVIILDPPTFSQSKEHGVFRAEKNYGELVSTALPLLKGNGILLASTNAADWRPEDFLDSVRSALLKQRRRVAQEHYVPQPPDFPICREQPAYLKTVWMRVGVTKPTKAR